MLTSEAFWTVVGSLATCLLVVWGFFKPDSQVQETDQERKIRAEECSKEEEIQRTLFEFWRARRDLRIMCEGDQELFDEAWPRVREGLEKRYPKPLMEEVKFRLLNMDKEHFPAKLFPHTKEQGGLYV